MDLLRRGGVGQDGGADIVGESVSSDLHDDSCAKRQELRDDFVMSKSASGSSTAADGELLQHGGQGRPSVGIGQESDGGQSSGEVCTLTGNDSMAVDDMKADCASAGQRGDLSVREDGESVAGNIRKDVDDDDDDEEEDDGDDEDAEDDEDDENEDEHNDAEDEEDAGTQLASIGGHFFINFDWSPSPTPPEPNSGEDDEDDSFGTVPSPTAETKGSVALSMGEGHGSKRGSRSPWRESPGSGSPRPQVGGWNRAGGHANNAAMGSSQAAADVDVAAAADADAAGEEAQGGQLSDGRSRVSPTPEDGAMFQGSGGGMCMQLSPVAIARDIAKKREESVGAAAAVDTVAGAEGEDREEDMVVELEHPKRGGNEVGEVDSGCDVSSQGRRHHGENDCRLESSAHDAKSTDSQCGSNSKQSAQNHGTEQGRLATSSSSGFSTDQVIRPSFASVFGLGEHGLPTRWLDSSGRPVSSDSFFTVPSANGPWLRLLRDAVVLSGRDWRNGGIPVCAADVDSQGCILIPREASPYTLLPRFKVGQCYGMSTGSAAAVGASNSSWNITLYKGATVTIDTVARCLGPSIYAWAKLLAVSPLDLDPKWLLDTVQPSLSPEASFYGVRNVSVKRLGRAVPSKKGKSSSANGASTKSKVIGKPEILDCDFDGGDDDCSDDDDDDDVEKRGGAYGDDGVACKNMREGKGGVGVVAGRVAKEKAVSEALALIAKGKKRGRTSNASSSSQQRPKGRKRGKVVASAAPGFLGKAMVKVDEPEPEPPGCARAVAFTPIPFDQKFRYIQLLLGSPEEPPGTQIMGSSVPSSGRGARGEQRGVMSSIVSSRDVGSDSIRYNALKLGGRRLAFRKSGIHGWGLYTSEPCEANEMLIEYVGEVISNKVCDKRERIYMKSGIGSSYMFRIDHKQVVDATMRGGPARFINHSCEPNAYTRVIHIGGRPKVVVHALRALFAGEEICYDYNFAYEDGKLPCRCLTNQCRGFMA